MEDMTQDERLAKARLRKYRAALAAARMRGAVAGDRTTVARAAVELADAEQAELRKTLDGLRDLRVEDYAKLDEAFDRAHRAEDGLRRVVDILNEHGQWYSGPLLYRTLCEALGIEPK